MIIVHKTTKGKKTMFKIEEENSLLISDKEIELQFCHCHDVCYGMCDLEDLKSEFGIDYPDEIHLLVIDEYNLCSILEIEKVDSGKMLQIKYCFHKEVPETNVFFSSFANFNLFFSNPDVLDKLKMFYDVDQCDGFVSLSRKNNVEDNIYSSIKNDLNNIKAILTN